MMETDFATMDGNPELGLAETSVQADSHGQATKRENIGMEPLSPLHVWIV